MQPLLFETIYMLGVVQTEISHEDDHIDLRSAFQTDLDVGGMAARTRGQNG